MVNLKMEKVTTNGSGMGNHSQFKGEKLFFFFLKEYLKKYKFLFSNLLIKIENLFHIFSSCLWIYLE